MPLAPPSPPTAGCERAISAASTRTARLVVADRRDDLVISGGENVYPAEVEAAARVPPGHRRCRRGRPRRPNLGRRAGGRDRSPAGRPGPRRPGPARLVPRAAGPLQGPRVVRAPRRAPEDQHRQAEAAGAPRDAHPARRSPPRHPLHRPPAGAAGPRPRRAGRPAPRRSRSAGERDAPPRSAARGRCRGARGGPRRAPRRGGRRARRRRGPQLRRPRRPRSRRAPPGPGGGRRRLRAALRPACRPRRPALLRDRRPRDPGRAGARRQGGRGARLPRARRRARDVGRDARAGAGLPRRRGWGSGRGRRDGRARPGRARAHRLPGHDPHGLRRRSPSTRRSPTGSPPASPALAGSSCPACGHTAPITEAPRIAHAVRAALARPAAADPIEETAP